MSFVAVRMVMASYIEGPSSLKFVLVALADRASKDTLGPAIVGNSELHGFYTTGLSDR